MLVKCFHVDEDDDIEEEGNEDEGDAPKDPGGEGRQSNWVGGSGPKSRDKKVHQHLLHVFTTSLGAPLGPKL